MDGTFPKTWGVSAEDMSIPQEERGEKEPLKGIKKFFSNIEQHLVDEAVKKFEDAEDPAMAANLAFVKSTGKVISLTVATAVSNHPVVSAVTGAATAAALLETYVTTKAAEKIEERKNAAKTAPV